MLAIHRGSIQYFLKYPLAGMARGDDYFHFCALLNQIVFFMKPIKTVVFSLFLSAVLFSCKKDDAPANSNTGNGSMTAKVAGNPFTATLAVQASVNSGVLSVAGTGSDGQINIAIPSYTGPATYNVGSGNFTTAIFTTTSAPFESYSANPVIGSGSVQVIEVTGGFVKGNFSFTGFSSGGATSKAITEGAFNIKLQ